MFKSSLALVVPAAIALFAASPALAAPQVIASLKPLHSLVAGVMAGVGEPDLLVRGAASEHGYVLRPSDAARIESADIVFWIGPDMETYLASVLDTLAADAAVVEMMDVDGLTLLKMREGGLFEPHSHDDDHGHEDHNHHDHGHDHDHSHADAHIWLDPQNARLMVAAIADALITADPQNAETYNANGLALAARLSDLEAEISAALEEVRDRPFLVFHDAYHYFEARFAIEAAGAFTINPEIAPGAARLNEIRGMVEASEAVCLFAEPQFSPAVVETIAEGTSARIGVLDPLGADLEDGSELYFTLIENLAASLTDCLSD